MSSSLMSGSQEGKKREIKGSGKGTDLTFPGILLSWSGSCLQQWRRCNNSGCRLSVYTSVIRSSNQQSEHRSQIFRGQGPSCPPWQLQTVCRLLHKQVHSCLPCGWGEGQIGATVLRVGTDWNQPQFNIQVFPCDFQAFSRLQSFKTVISDRFRQWNCCLGGGDRVLVFSFQPSYQNSPFLPFIIIIINF